MENSISKFKQAFPDHRSLVVALHSLSLQHALEWAQIALENGAHGVALVTHAISPLEGIVFAEHIKKQYPYHQVLLNILQSDPLSVLKIVHEVNIDGVWTDKSRIPWIDRVHDNDTYADDTLKWIHESWYNKLYLWWLDFKHQKPLTAKEFPYAVEQGKKYLDVITTSWAATWISADTGKVANIKSLAWWHPVWLASGVSPENIHAYIENTDLFIVASKISKWYNTSSPDYWNLDPSRVVNLSWMLEQYNRKMDRKHFEVKTLEKYGMSSVPGLYDYLNHWDIINIGMRPEFSEVQKKLSNLYPSPFILDGVQYASIEAFWMSIKYPFSDPRRVEIRDLSWVPAKHAGRDARRQKTLCYLWQKIVIWSQEHHDLLKRALRAKLEQNPDILEALLSTGDRELVHVVFTKDNQYLLHDSKTIPWEKFARLYTELRNEFRGSSV